jgi:hypothetical protein
MRRTPRRRKTPCCKTGNCRGDPPRWSQPDNSDAARARTLRKEIGAALAEARQAGKARPANAAPA